MMKYELSAIYDGKKSFYGKATVTEYRTGEKILRSYNTDVARITADGSFLRTWAGWSATTTRHVNEFRKQNGFAALSKKEWERLPVSEISMVHDVVELLEEYGKLA